MDGTRPNILDYETPRRHPRRLLGNVLVSLAILALLATIVILYRPSGRSRDRSPPYRLMCQSNLRQIGCGILLYTNDHAGQYPDSLGTVLLNEDIEPRPFVCPSSNAVASAKPTAREQAAEIDSGKCCSYVYLGRGLVEGAPADQVVIYEPLSNHGGYGMNVLFGDGRVEWIDKVQAASILNQVAGGKAVVRYPDVPTTMPTTTPSRP